MNTGVGCHALLQGNLPNPGIKPTSLLSPAFADGLFTTKEFTVGYAKIYFISLQLGDSGLKIKDQSLITANSASLNVSFCTCVCMSAG